MEGCDMGDLLNGLTGVGGVTWMLRWSSLKGASWVTGDIMSLFREA